MTSTNDDALHYATPTFYNFLCHMYTILSAWLALTLYGNSSVCEQWVYDFSLIQDAEINISFSICETILAYASTFLSQTDHCSWRFLSAVVGRRLPIHHQYADPVGADSPVTLSQNLLFWCVINVSLCNLHL